MATVVLVHGSWFSSDAWTETAGELQRLGHRTVALDLPGHGDDHTALDQISLDSYTDAVIATVRQEPESVILVGHSMGGTVISQVAERLPERVVHLVYIAAFMLADGQSLFAVTQSSPGMAASLLGQNLVFGDGELFVDPSNAIAVFMDDAPSLRASTAADRMRPEPLAPLATPIHVTAERWGSVPRTYVHTSNDRVLPIASQLELVAAAPGTGVVELATSHSPFLSEPEQLAAAIIAAASPNT